MLTELSDSIGNLVNLYELTFDYNYIREVPDSVRFLSKLREIAIHGNYFREIPEVFKTADKCHLLWQMHDLIHDCARK